MSVSDIPDQTDYFSNIDSLAPMGYAPPVPGSTVAFSSMASFVAPSVNTTGNNIMSPPGTMNGSGKSNGFQFNPMQFVILVIVHLISILNEFDSNLHFI